MKNDLATDCIKKEMTPIKAVKDASFAGDTLNMPLTDIESKDIVFPVSKRTKLLKTGMDIQTEIDGLSFGEGVVFDSTEFDDITIDTTTSGNLTFASLLNSATGSFSSKIGDITLTGTNQRVKFIDLQIGALSLGNTPGNNYVSNCYCTTLAVLNAGYNQLFRTTIGGTITATAYTFFIECRTDLIANLPVSAMIDSTILVSETMTFHYMTATGWVDSGVSNQYRAIKELNDILTALEGA